MFPASAPLIYVRFISPSDTETYIEAEYKLANKLLQYIQETNLDLRFIIATVLWFVGDNTNANSVMFGYDD